MSFNKEGWYSILMVELGIYIVLPERSSVPVISLRNRGPLKVLNDFKLILDDQRGHSDSS